MKEVFETDLWEQTRGHLSTSQALYIKELIHKHKPKNVIEIGFCTGRSCSSVIYYGAEWLEVVTSIESNVYTDTVQHADKLKTQFPNVKFSLIDGDSRQLVPGILKDNSPDKAEHLDWATIDGGHDYDSCIKDMDNVHPFMAPGGVILIDDYKAHPPEGSREEGVDRACEEFYKEHEALYDLHEWNVKGKGFCVLTRKA